MEINLGKGKVCLVDIEDWPKVSKFKWHCSGKYASTYAREKGGKIVAPKDPSSIALTRRPKMGSLFISGTPFYKDGSKDKSVFLHRFIMDAPKNMEVDHINGNGLDNRKVNLRLCTRAQNGRNRKLSVNNKSGFHGVYYAKTEKRKKRWVASIRFNGKKRFLGRFYTAEEAAHTYDKFAKKFHGSFATLNFLEEELAEENSVVK